MATISVSIQSGPVTGSRSFTLSDADVQAILDWIQDFYGDRLLSPNPTNAQLMNAWASLFVIGQTKTQILRKRQQRAAQDAIKAQVGITVT